MLLKNNQVDELLSIIDFTHTVFIAGNVGYDPLTEDDKILLRKFKINPEDYRDKYTPFQSAYLFGKLSQALGDNNTKKLNYNDLKKYIRNGQYEKMTPFEKDTYRIAQKRTYGHIKGLQEKIKNTINGIIVENDSKHRAEYEKLIGNTVKKAVRDRQSVKDIVSAIGNKTNDWGRDLGRIAETEMHAVYQLGRAEQIVKQYGWDAEVYFDVFPMACRHCIKLFLTKGIGSQPKIFKLSELIANGNNIGRKVDDWVPSLTGIHPFCRCQIHYLHKNYEWNKLDKKFELQDRAPEVTFGIKIKVGDKIFSV